MVRGRSDTGELCLLEENTVGNIEPMINKTHTQTECSAFPSILLHANLQNKCQIPLHGPDPTRQKSTDLSETRVSNKVWFMSNSTAWARSDFVGDPHQNMCMGDINPFFLNEMANVVTDHEILVAAFTAATVSDLVGYITQGW